MLVANLVSSDMAHGLQGFLSKCRAGQSSRPCLSGKGLGLKGKNCTKQKKQKKIEMFMTSEREELAIHNETCP